MPLRQGETIPQLVVRIAREQGLDARATKIALAIVAQESAFNPQAEGDWSDSKKRMRSIGLFQLNEEGMGSGMGDSRYDPEANATKGIKSLKAAYDKHGTLSDGEIAYLSQRPANKAEYVGSINAKTSGQDQQWRGTIDTSMRAAGVGGGTNGPVFPVAGQNLGNTTVTTEHGARGTNTGFAGVPETHRGSDLSAKRGTPALATAPGKVTTAHKWTGGKDDPYGNWIEIQGDDGNKYRYAHLQDMSVQVGARVGGGQQIGSVDSTGNSSGDHLHFEVLDAKGNPTDPKAYLSNSQTSSGTSGASGERKMADTSQANALVAELQSQAEEQEQKVKSAKSDRDTAQAQAILLKNQQRDIQAKRVRTPSENALLNAKSPTGLPAQIAELEASIPELQKRLDAEEQLRRGINSQLAVARQQATGKELDPSQVRQNDAAADQARASAAKLEEDVRASKDPNSPDNVAKLAQANLLKKQADAYEESNRIDNAHKTAQTDYTTAQAEYSRGTMDSVIRQHLAAAGLNEAQTAALMGKMQPEINQIIATTGKIKNDAEHTRALTKASNETLPYIINKYKADIGYTDAQANELSALLPGKVTLQGTQARLDLAQAEAQRASGISSLTTAQKTQYEMQTDAWKNQTMHAIRQRMSDPNFSSNDISGLLMSAASDAQEMINAFNADVTRRTAEESARNKRVTEGIDIQRADEEMRNNLANNITSYMNARSNQQNASTQAVGPMIGPARVANTLAGLGPLMGEGDKGIRSIGARMGAGAGVMDGVVAGLKEYQGTIKDFKSRMPNVRMADPNVKAPSFVSPGTSGGMSYGISPNLPPPPSAPNLNLPSSVEPPALPPPPEASVPAAAPTAGNTPPDQMDDTGNDLPQQPTEEEIAAQQEDEGQGGGGGAGGAYSFRAPRGHGAKAKKKPNRAQRAMGAFTPPLGRAA